MLFNSLTFVALLIPLLAAYWCSNRQSFRLVLLFAGSLVFYGYHHWPSVFLLLFTIGFNFLMGKLQADRGSRLILSLAIAVNLSLIFWFKYASFAAENLNTLLGLLGVSLQVPRVPVFLPLGIAFFTFQVVAYQVDVYRREIQPEPSLLRFAVFKSFFPQLIAGPIVRAAVFLPQLRQARAFDAAAFHQGIWLVLAGMALKIGVADVLAQFVTEAFRSPGQLSTVGAWTSLYAFAFQLYADFWGYSTMAVGLAALFGLVLPLNFDTPYGAGSLQEFWRRWHITLSIWFRDYVYIPLGGNRHRRNFNLLLTMVLAGLWHGAGWPFLFWGLAHGLWLAGERFWVARFPASPDRFWRGLKMVLVFHGVCLLWVLFRSPDLVTAGEYYSRLLLPPFTTAKVPGVLSVWLIGFLLLQRPLANTFTGFRFVGMPLRYQWPLAWACLYFILAYAGARVDFIYFTF